MPNIRETQKRLSRWATDHPWERYRDLWNLVTSPAWLMEAYCHISVNKGAETPGIDGKTIAAWEKNLVGNMDKLIDELIDGSYRPMPCRRVYIPKRNGKMRPLGIPALRDRIVQEAIRMAIEPIYEADFLEYSFGFRPGRSTHDAFAAVRTWMIDSRRMRYVIEGDIKGCFDAINHTKLMSLLRRRIKDKRVVSLLWLFLKAGVMEQGVFSETGEGTPQGGVISPLLANIYLHELDRYLYDRFLGDSPNKKTYRRRCGGYNIGYVRYADDFVVFCNGSIDDVKQLKHDIAAFLGEELQLMLSEEKTLITHVNDGFDFLGFQFYRGLSRQGKWVPKTRVPQSRIEAVKEKVKHITEHSRICIDEAAIVRNLNRILLGWGNYYCHTPAGLVFSNVDHYAYWRLVKWYRRKHRWTTAQVLRNRQTREPGDLRLFADWCNIQGESRRIRLKCLTRDITFSEYWPRRIANPFLCDDSSNLPEKSKWKAGCGETRTSGLGGGVEKPAAVR